MLASIPRTTTALLVITILAAACTDTPPRERVMIGDSDTAWDLNQIPGEQDDAGGNAGSDADGAWSDVGGFDDGDVPAEEEPGIPGQLTAADTPEGVRLAWSAVADAVGYEIARDGTPLISVGASALEYLDTDAGPASPWGALSALTASADRPDGVRIDWTFEAPSPGPVHRYVVRAIFAEGVGQDSRTVEGRRAPRPVVVDVRANDGPWRSSTTQGFFLDTQAPYGTFEAGRTRASKGAHTDRVHLSIVDLARTHGPQVTYQVRLSDGHHPEELSSTVVGRRGPADPLVQWERSSGPAPSGFAPVQGATSAPMGDLTAPEDGTIRYWRARLHYPGGAEQLSEPDYGYRAVGCPVDTNFFGQLGGPGERDGGVPTLAPLTDDANLEAIWAASLPAPNWADPQALNPSIAISGATITAVTHRPIPQFWVEDAHRSIQVYLDEALPEALKVGQRVSFRATHVGIFNGNPEVRGLTDFTVLSADNPVPYIDIEDREISLDDHYYRVVRVGGELGPNASPCGDGHTCYELFYGPTGGRKSIPLRSASNQLAPGRCITFVGPAIGYLGPMSNLPDPPMPQLETISFSWHRASN